MHFRNIGDKNGGACVNRLLHARHTTLTIIAASSFYNRNLSNFFFGGGGGGGENMSTVHLECIIDNVSWVHFRNSLR